MAGKRRWPPGATGEQGPFELSWLRLSVLQRKPCQRGSLGLASEGCRTGCDEKQEGGWGTVTVEVRSQRWVDCAVGLAKSWGEGNLCSERPIV